MNGQYWGVIENYHLGPNIVKIPIVDRRFSKVLPIELKVQCSEDRSLEDRYHNAIDQFNIHWTTRKSVYRLFKLGLYGAMGSGLLTFLIFLFDGIKNIVWRTFFGIWIMFGCWTVLGIILIDDQLTDNAMIKQCSLTRVSDKFEFRYDRLIGLYIKHV